MKDFISERVWEFKIVLQPLDTLSDEHEDSPIFFDDRLRGFDKLNDSINSEIWVNELYEVSKLLSSAESSPTLPQSTNISKFLRELELTQYFRQLRLTPEQIYVFRYFHDEALSTFGLSITTVYLAFNVYLQYTLKSPSTSTPVVVASLFLASKFKETLYKIPFLEELVSHAQKSIFLSKPSETITEESVKNAEVGIMQMLDWNLMQTSLLEVSQYLLDPNWIRDLTDWDSKRISWWR